MADHLLLPVPVRLDSRRAGGAKSPLKCHRESRTPIAGITLDFHEENRLGLRRHRHRSAAVARDVEEGAVEQFTGADARLARGRRRADGIVERVERAEYARGGGASRCEAKLEPDDDRERSLAPDEHVDEIARCRPRGQSIAR